MTVQAYFHGGPAGLAEILPPSVTATPSSADCGAERVCRRDRVYLTTSAEAARVFALFAPCKGSVAVYEVLPIGDVLPDPDCVEPGLSVECERAHVVRVFERIKPKRRASLLARVSA